MALTAEQIRQGLSLPNTEAGREVAGMLVERDPLDEPELYISSREFGEAPDRRVNSTNFERVLGRASSPQEQVQILRGLTQPGSIGGRQLQVGSVPGGREYLNARLRLAEAAANPQAAPPGGAPMPNLPANWVMSTTEWGMRNELAMRAKAIGGSAAVAGGLTMATVGGAIATGVIFATAPAWVPIALIGTGAVLVVGGGIALWNSVF
ncbi:MAG: hypothetical protein ACAI38_01405 [Myxococcota bacterium]